MTPLFALAIVLLLLAVLILAGVLPLKGLGSGADIRLRDLLLARAAGEIDEAEFVCRQEALHAALLAAPAARPRWHWALPLLLVSVLLGWFGWKGDDSEMAPKPTTASAPLLDTITKGEQKANSGGDLKSLVKPLADKLAKDPANGEGWLLLARTYRELHQYAEAAPAYERAAALLPADAALLAEWADSYVIAHDRKWDDTARSIVKRAIGAGPKHLMALALAGSESFDRRDYKAAIGYWERMRSVAPPGSMDAKLAESNIQEAKGLMAKQQ